MYFDHTCPQFLPHAFPPTSCFLFPCFFETGCLYIGRTVLELRVIHLPLLQLKTYTTTPCLFKNNSWSPIICAAYKLKGVGSGLICWRVVVLGVLLL